MDVYGVAYNCGEQSTLIEGSVEAIDKLRKAGIPFRFCSNTSTKPSSEVIKSLRSFGFDVKDDEVFTPIPALKKFLKVNNYRPFLLLDPNTDSLFTEFDQTNPNCVVLGDAKHRFSYENLNKAFQILTSNPDSVLVTLGTGKYYKETEGTMLDCGTFAKALEFASDKTAVIIGKPSKDYFLTALESMQIKPEEVVMIGDDIVGDVQGAQRAGLTGIQVRTGKYRSSDEPHSFVKPDGYVNNLLEAVDCFLGKRN